MASVPDRLAFLKRVRWRPMAEADLAYVATLENEIHAAPWSLGNFRDTLAAGYGATVADEERTLRVARRFTPETTFLGAHVVPADYVDRPKGEGGDPQCGLSNHEGPRVEYLKRADAILTISADDPALLNTLQKMVPNYHLSKFQPYLPDELKLRLVADTIYDVEGTLAFLEKN